MKATYSNSSSSPSAYHSRSAGVTACASVGGQPLLDAAGPASVRSPARTPGQARRSPVVSPLVLPPAAAGTGADHAARRDRHTPRLRPAEVPTPVCPASIGPAADPVPCWAARAVGGKLSQTTSTPGVSVEPRFLLLSDVAAELNVSDSQVYHMVRSGELPGDQDRRTRAVAGRARPAGGVHPRKYAETAEWVREQPAASTATRRGGRALDAAPARRHDPLGVTEVAVSRPGGTTVSGTRVDHAPRRQESPRAPLTVAVLSLRIERCRRQTKANARSRGP